MSITIEEKRKAIGEYCDNRGNDCIGCPIANLGFCERFTETNASDETINEWYDELVKHLSPIEEEREPTPILESEMIKLDNRDNVNHPAHYGNGSIECIDAMLATQGVEAVQSFCVCNAFKYLWRHNNKNQLEDIKKAIWYLNKFVELEDKRNGRVECLPT